MGSICLRSKVASLGNNNVNFIHYLLLFPRRKICFQNICFSCAWTGRQVLPQPEDDVSQFSNILTCNFWHYFERGILEIGERMSCSVCLGTVSFHSGEKKLPDRLNTTAKRVICSFMYFVYSQNTPSPPSSHQKTWKERNATLLLPLLSCFFGDHALPHVIACEFSRCAEYTEGLHSPKQLAPVGVVCENKWIKGYVSRETVVLSRWGSEHKNVDSSAVLIK